MAPKITQLADVGLDHPVFDGVPRTTGQSSAGGDAEALKLLMFMDGSSSLRDLGEVLTMEPAVIIRIITSLHGEGVIEFDEAYAKEWLEKEAPVEEGLLAADPEEVLDPSPGSVASGEGLHVIGSAQAESTPIPESSGEAARPGGPPEEEEPEEVPGEIIEEGRLDDTPAWQVLTRISRTDFKGWIRFSGPSGRREVLMTAGRPVFCRSDVEDEDLASLLRQRDRLEEEGYQQYREAREPESEASRLMVRLGLLPEYNRLRALRWQAQTILYSTLVMDSGTFLVERLEALPRRMPRFDLNFSRILTKFLDEKLPVDEEVQKLEEKMDYYLVHTAGAGEQSFQEKEQRLWEVIQERPRRLRDLFSVSTMFRKETYKFILLLLVNGLAELTKTVAWEEGPLDLRLIDDLADDLEEQNYFEVLGVHAVSDSEDIEAGYRRMAGKFDPSAFKNLDDVQRAALARCRARIQEAHGALASGSRRSEYRKEVFTTYQLAQFAQLQYQKGEIYLWWRQNPRDAFPFFSSAMELDPARPLYWAAFAMSALSGGSSDPGVRRKASQLADRVASLGNAEPTALVLAGGALMKIGQAGRGEECLKKATKLSPGNAAISKMIKTVLSKGEG
jgi:hypothetical protein